MTSVENLCKKFDWVQKHFYPETWFHARTALPGEKGSFLFFKGIAKSSNTRGVSCDFGKERIESIGFFSAFQHIHYCQSPWCWDEDSTALGIMVRAGLDGSYWQLQTHYSTIEIHYNTLSSLASALAKYEIELDTSKGWIDRWAGTSPYIAQTPPTPPVLPPKS